MVAASILYKLQIDFVNMSNTNNNPLATCTGRILVVADGKDGVGIKNADVVFAIGSRKDIAPADGDNWVSTFAELVLTADGYIWTCTKIIKTDGKTEYTGKYCLGACTSFADIVELYALGDSNVTPPQDGWQQSYTPVKGKWLWTKNELHFQNSTNVTTTKAICVCYFSKDGENGTSFNLCGTAKGIYNTFSAMKEKGTFEVNDKYLLVSSNDADSTANNRFNKPSVAMFLNAHDYDWYISSANVGDAYRIDTNLWVCTETNWVNMGNIQGPEGEPGTDAIWLVLTKNQVTFESDKSGMAVAGSKSIGIRVFVGTKMVDASLCNLSIKSGEDFDETKATIIKGSVTSFVTIDSSGISSKKISDNLTISYPFSSVKVEISYEDYVTSVVIGIVVDTSVQDGYFHTSIEGLEAKYTKIDTNTNELSTTVSEQSSKISAAYGSIQLITETQKLTSQTVNGMNQTMTEWEKAGVVTKSNYAGLFAEYAKNGQLVTSSEISVFVTKDEAGHMISVAKISANNVVIDADNILSITGNYITIDATNFKLTKSGDVSVKGKIEATSGSIGNLKITDKLYSSDTGNGNVQITPASIQVNGAGDDWANGSKISFNASGISSFAEFYGISPNPVVTIGNGLVNGYGGGPALKLDPYYAFSPSLILGGFIHGFSRGICYFDDNSSIITKEDRIAGDMKDVNGEYLGSCFVYGGAGDKTIYLDGSTYAGDELVIMNESTRPIKIKIKSNYVDSKMNVMWINGYSSKVSEYSLGAGCVIHGIYSGNYWHLW